MELPKNSTRLMGTLAVAITALAFASRAEAQTTFFSDNFDRSDGTDLDASTNGMGGILVSAGARGVGNTWLEPVDDARSVPGDSQVVANKLRMGGNGHAVYITLNQNLATVLASGTVSVSLDLTTGPGPNDGTALHRHLGIGVGFTLAEGTPNVDRQLERKADLFIAETANGLLRINDEDASTRPAAGDVNPTTTIDLDPGTVFIAGSLRIDMTITNTAAGSTVVYDVFFNGSDVLPGTRSFVLSDNNEFYVGIDERSATAVEGDNFSVSATSYTAPPVTALTWRALQNNAWDASTANWVDSGLGISSYAFFDGANVTFSDITSNTSVNVTTAVSPGSMVVNNSSSNYTFSGAGSIGGTGTLTKSGTGSLALGLPNTYSGGTLISGGMVKVGNNGALGSGQITIGGSSLSSDGTTARTLANSLLITSASTLGDAADNGVLTFGGPLDFSGAARNVTVPSEVVFTGGASNGRVGTLQGSGIMRFLNGVVDFSGGASDVKEGTLIVDGATVTNTDRLIVDAELGTGVARMVVTNGGSITTLSALNNLRVGRASPVPGTNIVDLAGLYSTPNVNSANGRILLHNAASLYSELNFFTGGEYSARSVGPDGGGANPTRINFDGGMIRALENNDTFFEGITETYVRGGGAKFDDGGYSLTLNQALMDGGGGGGLTKLGAGTLTLAGYCTYTGPTLVSNGTLVVSGSSFGGGGALAVAGSGNLQVTDGNGTVSASSLTLGPGAGGSVTFHFPYGNAFAPTLMVGSLAANATAYINITGNNFTTNQFTLVQFTSGTGLANIQLGSVQPGVSAVLVKNANSIDLLITSVVNSLTWTGAKDNLWDLTSTNWADAFFVSTNYMQSGGAGDAVTFDDFAMPGSTDINLTLAVSPVAMTFNNSSYNYTFTGAGKLTGVGKLTKNGYAAVTLGTVNDFSGGSVLNAGNTYLGADQALGSGDVTLNFGTLASDSAAARTLSNAIILNADIGVVLGDTVNTGVLNLAGKLDLGTGGGRTLQLNSDVVITGSGLLTNGGFTTKSGPGHLIVRGEAHQTALVNHQQGDVILDGGWLESGNGWRMQNTFPGTSLRFVVTNGGRFTLNLNSANFRVGLTGGDNTCDNVLDIAGTVSLYSTTGNGRIDMGQSGANAILNLRSGGLLSCRSITSTSPGNTIVNLDGGTLMPIANEAAFMQGLTNAYVQNGGVIVDTTNLNITIAQPLEAAGSGGLTKLGAGILTLSGASTYTGPTTVSAGKLVLTTAHLAPGTVTVASNATCAFLSAAPGTMVQVQGVTTVNGSMLEAQFSGLASNPAAPAAFVTNLVVNGTVGVNITAGGISAGQFPLLGYGSLSGSGNLVVGQLPQGVVGTLVTNAGAKTIDLVVNSVTPLVWKGSVNGTWDLTTTNWTLSGSPALFGQGDNVRFDDSAVNSFLTLTLPLTPGSVTVSNSALGYQFGFNGNGGLSGSMGLVKQGTNSLALNSPNSFLGSVTVKAGTLIAGSGTALGADTGATTVESGATLDIGGQNLGLEHILVTGSGVAGLGSLVNNGGDQNDALRNVTLTGDTTVGTTSGIGLRTGADSDLGLVGNGYKLTKVGTGGFRINGGKTVAGLTKVWTTDLGDIDILEGSLSFQRRTALGNPTNTISVAPGAALDLFSLNLDLPVPTNTIVMNNATLEGTGAVGDTNILGGKITVSGSNNNVSVVLWTGTAGPTLLYLNGPIVGSGGIRYDGSPSNSVIQLAGANSYSGDTEMSRGTLRLVSSGALSGTANITVHSNAVLDVLAVSPWTLGAAQTLRGSGTIEGSVMAAGTVAPGTSVGTITVNGDLTLSGGLSIEVDKSLAQSNDVVAVSGAVVNVGSGTLNVANIGITPLAPGDRFELFPGKTVAGGEMLTVTGASATWTNKLAVDGSIEVLTASSVASNPTNITYSVSGGSLNLSWPADHLGWVLQAQTNGLNVGLSTNWAPYNGGYAGSTNAVIPISPSTPTVFFRLAHP